MIQVEEVASCLSEEVAHEGMLKMQVLDPRGQDSCEDSLSKEPLLW